MTPHEITHHSNGIWTCGGCGEIVDKLECDYSPAQLVEMKRVREAAEKMAVSDPQIRGISCYLSPIEFDEVFWKNLPSLEVDKIRPALQEIAAREMQRLCERSSRDLSVPGHLSLRPLVSAIKTIIESDGDDPPAFLNRTVAHPYPHSRSVGDDHTVTRRRAAEIVDAWAERIQSHHWSGTEWHIHYVNVLITARHPQTGVVCESPIRVVGNGYGRHDHTADEGEVLRLKVRGTSSLVSNLNWQLDVALDKGVMLTTSALRLAGRLSPSNFHSPRWEEEFDSYEQVVQKLAEGWQPIGFVDMNPDQSSIEDRMHPEAFEIELQITASELDECLYRCSKIRLARVLERQWGWWFACTEAYFERGLDLTMIQSASDELRARLGPPPYLYRGESPPLVSVGKRDIKLVARDGTIAFKDVLRRR
ncbi:hypothetical protein [Variovorax sp. YR634]|uniref:hypothetical protein n=1 Tax=Variovorax sp. YR634 TaxID=1884385 RepID=UPI00115FBF2C|nr:hypothetical protein [Variovorax sp. YR634]